MLAGHLLSRYIEAEPTPQLKRGVSVRDCPTTHGKIYFLPFCHLRCCCTQFMHVVHRSRGFFIENIIMMDHIEPDNRAMAGHILAPSESKREEWSASILYIICPSCPATTALP